MIQITKETDLTKTGNTRNENKAQVWISALEHCKEPFEDSTVLIVQVL